MTRPTLPRALLAAALLFLTQLVASEIPVPPLKSRVTDLTNTLTADQRAALEAKLATFEIRKGSQVAVLMVPTTQPEAIEQYSIRVVDQWKLGRKRVDDGVFLIVAKNDRKVRIEVGRGLEGALPDAIAKRIIDEVITPRFRENDFYGGITAGVDRILRVIEGEPLPPPKAPAQKAPGGGPGWFELLFIGIILATVVGGFLRALFGRFLGAGIVGAAAGALGYVLVGLGAAVTIAIIAFLVSLFTGALGRGSVGRSGWYPGGGWGSGGGGFGGGGGGFSGGGGGFSGGGASGSW
jgi:uncharacterized protein